MCTDDNMKIKKDNRIFIVHPKTKEGVNLTCRVTILSNTFTNNKTANVTVSGSDSIDIITISTERDIDHNTIAHEALDMLGINYTCIEEAEWLYSNSRILKVENYTDPESHEECNHRYKDGKSALVTGEYPYVNCKLCGSKISIYTGEILDVVKKEDNNIEA